ncbi:GPW/gp25 family protein [Chachezhania antarctica]|uniref:GPW/gp25 family protein n=1 Tax=Chachezhania antarctica TaxID=2340860 RepID=UPI000EAE3743|nr:GPW/gp25 family protein [Chachezhania antarctica]|tara:strand:+ start:158 stop:553 length:396 start_codon:yes stop_codon:yes gene_type:complete
MSSPIRASKHSRNFRYPLQVEAGADRLAQQPDYATHVEEMIRQILLTDHGERVMRPDLGTTLYSLVFEPLRGASATMIRASVHASLEKHLGDLIKVIAVKVEVDETALHVHIAWHLKSDPGRRVLTLEVPT